MLVEYDDQLETLMDKVNKELRPRGLQFIDDGKEHAGIVIYELVEVSP